MSARPHAHSRRREGWREKERRRASRNRRSLRSVVRLRRPTVEPVATNKPAAKITSAAQGHEESRRGATTLAPSSDVQLFQAIGKGLRIPPGAAPTGPGLAAHPPEPDPGGAGGRLRRRRAGHQLPVLHPVVPASAAVCGGRPAPSGPERQPGPVGAEPTVELDHRDRSVGPTGLPARLAEPNPLQRAAGVGQDQPPRRPEGRPRATPATNHWSHPPTPPTCRPTPGFPGPRPPPPPPVRRPAPAVTGHRLRARPRRRDRGRAVRVSGPGCPTRSNSGSDRAAPGRTRAATPISPWCPSSSGGRPPGSSK